MNKFLFFAFTLLCFANAFGQDRVITKNGDVFEAYRIDVGSNYVYYTKEDKENYLAAAKAYSRFNGGLKKYFDAKPAMFNKIGKRIASENAAIFYENMVIIKKFSEKVSLTEFVNEFNNRLSSKPSSDKYGCKPFTEDEITKYFSSNRL